MNRKDNKLINDTYLSGELISGVKFRYNSRVKIKLEDGTDKIGWVVGVELLKPEPIYTVETEGGPDIEIAESCIMVLSKPHE